MRVSTLVVGALAAQLSPASTFTPLASVNRQSTVVQSTIRSQWRMDDLEPEVSTGVLRVVA
jgi:hypothetical protein